MPFVPSAIRKLDHLVLPVRDLEQARQRLEALGFTLADKAEHPFGTANACIFLPDGTYLEPLAVCDRLAAEEAARAGNPFVRRDGCYRFRVGEEGFSLAAFASENAKEDYEDFRRAGFGYGPVLRFSRKGESNKDIAFNLAFALDERSPDAGFFTCERAGKGGLFSGRDIQHDNGITGIGAVIMGEENPSDFQYLLQAVTGCRDFNATSSGLSFELQNAALHALTPEALEKLFLIPAQRQERGLRFEAVILQCASLARIRQILEENAVDYLTHMGRIMAPPAPGQGIPLLFEESPS